MSEPTRPVLAALLLLTLVTGIVDAVSVLGPGHVFTANMTGNVVFLGFALVGAGHASVQLSVTALGSFLAGAVVGGRVSKVSTARSVRLGFGIEVGLLVLAVGVMALAPRAVGAAVSLLACSMGVRNALVRRLAIADMTTTVLTLTLTGLAADSSLAGGANPRWPRRVAAVVCMLAGALLGASMLPLGVAWVTGAAAALEAIAVAILVRGAGLAAAFR